MNLILRYYNLKGGYLFIGIIAVNILVTWLSKSLLIDEVVFYNTYSEQLTYERSLQLFENMQRFSWLSYVILPVVLLLKFTIISIVIYTGVFFFNKNEKVKYKRIFKIIVASEIVFIVVSISKLLWFHFFGGNYDLNDLGFFYPLSLINLFDISEVNKVWVYPLQVINIFQIVYIILISYALKNVCNINPSVSDRIVLSAYLPALVIWVVLIMFLTIETTL
jgi:hypothetical protein